MNKHYVRLEENSDIVILGYSDAFFEPWENDICIRNNAGRHFEINGEINPGMIHTSGCPRWQLVDGKLKETDKEWEKEWLKLNINHEDTYRIKVKQLVHEKYDQDTEIGITNDAILAQAAGEELPQNYWEYRAYVEECKDKAHMEVYGYERT